MNTTYSWYQELIRPEWAPPSWVFGPVWSILYTIIFISFGYVFYKIYRKELNKEIAYPFILNLTFNLAFSPIQFQLQNNLLAFIDILLVLATLIWFIKVIWKKAKWVAIVNIPYLLWVSFATILQGTITYLNF